MPNQAAIRGKAQGMVRGQAAIQRHRGAHSVHLRGVLPETATGDAETDGYGFVYLLQGHPGEYKIGYTKLVDRRVAELGAIASVEPKLMHEIKTDDPSGVEAYWHKRFESKAHARRVVSPQSV